MEGGGRHNEKGVIGGACESFQGTHSILVLYLGSGFTSACFIDLKKPKKRTFFLFVCFALLYVPMIL